MSIELYVKKKVYFLFVGMVYFIVKSWYCFGFYCWFVVFFLIFIEFVFSNLVGMKFFCGNILYFFNYLY